MTNLSTQPQLIKFNRRTYAEIRSDCVLQKHIRGSLHFLRKPWLSIAFDESVLDIAEKAGVVWVEVHDDESGQVYHAPLAEIRANGFKVNYVSPQIALALRNWRKGRVANPVPQQLALVGGGL